jgi:hypothetical protein
MSGRQRMIIRCGLLHRYGIVTAAGNPDKGGLKYPGDCNTRVIEITKAALPKPLGIATYGL